MNDWEKAKKIFTDAIKFAPDERSLFLDEVCADDGDTRREVESLLSSYDDAESFMENPAVGEVAEAIRQDKNLERGKCFGHYEIIKQIGAGGMGEVYLAKDKKLDRRVAVKILNEKFSRHESNLSRFIQEAKAASALNHPNILVIHEIGEAETANYIVSEFIEGKTLRDGFKELPMKLSEVLDIATQIANALSAAHAANIVHRDIKPENIMIRPDGFVKILDFGLAKLVEQKTVGFEDETVKQNETAKGVILGTVNYMSPEQAKSEKVDERTDIFSFGAVVYEMVAGRTPFAGDSVSETFANLINSEPQPLSRFAANVPDELQRIVSKMLCKNKDERYQTMKDVLTDLKDLRENLAFDERLEKLHSPSGENATAILQATTDEANKQTDETNYNFTPQIKRHKPLTAYALIILLIGTIGFGYYFLSLRNTTSSAGIKKSLAVLPFVNSSQDANVEYLSDGITESVINNLSQLSGLKVMSRNSAFRFKNNQTDTKNIASQLGVEVLVTGDIKQLGDKLIINVRLIDGRDDSQIWGNQYVKNSGDVIAAQNEIAQAVANNLRLKLTNTEQQEIKKRPTENAEAYQLYLKGHLLQRKATPQDGQKAIGYFEQAIALDPNFAAAYVGLSDVYDGFLHYIDLPPSDYKQKSREFILKALSLDDQLPEAHASFGNMLLGEYDFAGAEREFKRAIELNPNYTDGHLDYGELLAYLGRGEESIVEMQRGLELDPISLSANRQYGESLYYARRYDEAITQLKKTLELDANYYPVHYYLAIAYEMKGDYAASVAERVKINELVGTRQRAEAMQKSFDQGGWQGFLRDATGDNPPFNVPPYILATFCAELGEKDKAFARLNKLYEARDRYLPALKVEPRFDSLHDDPRFIDLMRRMNFE